jgi:HK97 family phage major capsid protein
MTLAELIAQLRSQMAERLEQRNQNATRLAELRAGANVDETEVQRLRDANTGLDAEVDQLQARVADLEAELSRDDAAGRLQRELVPTGTQRRQGGTTITSEPRTYTRETARRGEARFFSDAWNAQRGNIAARDRIERHATEVLREGEMSERALATGGVAGLVVPQYLVDLAAPVLRAGRPFANACNHHELPDEGMSLVVPRGTTGASAAAQAAENSGVSSTDEVWTNLTVPVCTVAGQAPVSRQTLERGQGMDEVIYQDLVRAHAAQVDNYCWNGSGSSGQSLGLLNTSGIGAATAFGAAPTITNTALKIAGAITGVTSAGAGLFPKFLFMHPRRWGWFTAQVDSQGRPVVLANQVGAVERGRARSPSPERWAATWTRSAV